MTRTKKPNSIRILVTILIVVLAAALIGGATYGIIRLVQYNKSDTKKPSLDWQVGALDVNGEYRASKGSLYTKDAFACQGLTVSLAFDSNVTYQIYFYDSGVKFISSTTMQTGNFEEKLPEVAAKARIVITPKNDKDISWTEKNGYVKQLSISVLKDQTPKFERVNCEIETFENSINDFEGNQGSAVKYYATRAIDVSGYSEVCIFARYSVGVMFGDKNGKNVGEKIITNVGGTILGEDVLYYVDIPETAQFVRVGCTKDGFEIKPFEIYLKK